MGNICFLKIFDILLASNKTTSSNCLSCTVDDLTEFFYFSFLVPSTRTSVMRYYKKYLSSQANAGASDKSKELDDNLSSFTTDEVSMLLEKSQDGNLVSC